jgi:hypothetical protein
MTITYHKGVSSMDSLNFTLKGVPYLITGTGKVETDCGHWWRVDIKNLETGVHGECEHEKLCKIILKDQENEQNLHK